MDLRKTRAPPPGSGAFGGARRSRGRRADRVAYELWLKVAIVLLGVRFLFSDLVKLGPMSLGLVVVEIVSAGAIMIAFARAFGLGAKLTALLAIGSSVCGVSAIIATRGALDADEDDTAFAIASILAIGALGLGQFPIVGHALHLIVASDPLVGLK